MQTYKATKHEIQIALGKYIAAQGTGPTFSQRIENRIASLREQLRSFEDKPAPATKQEFKAGDRVKWLGTAYTFVSYVGTDAATLLMGNRIAIDVCISFFSLHPAPVEAEPAPAVPDGWTTL